MDRRAFLRLAVGAGTLVASPACGTGPSRSSRSKAAAAKPKLRILQFSHFVPAYDPWFDGFAARWGEEHDIDVVVDRVFVDDIRLRGAAEVSAGRGHDLFAFGGTPVSRLHQRRRDGAFEPIPCLQDVRRRRPGRTERRGGREAGRGHS